MALNSAVTMYCDKCCKDQEFRQQDVRVTIPIRNDPITASIPTLVCPQCGDQQPHPDHDAMEILYRKYEKKHGIWPGLTAPISPEAKRSKTLEDAEG